MLAASLACSHFLLPLQKAGADDVCAEVGFLSRAQRAQLVVRGKVRTFSVGLLGCGHDINVENILHGSLEGDHLSLNRVEGGCPQLPSHYRLILAIEEWDDVRFQIGMSQNVLGLNDFRYPIGTSWKVFLDKDDYVFGELSGCSGVSPGPVTHAPERMRLEDLLALLSGSEPPEGGSRQLDTESEPRVIEWEIRDFYDLPMGMHLEFVPLADRDRTVAISTDDSGRFRVTGVPGEAVWLRSMEDDIAPILLQPGVTVVHALLPSCSPLAHVWMR